MPRTKIIVSAIGLNGSAKPTLTDVDATNDMYLEYDRDDVMIVVTNTTDPAADKNITIKAASGVSAEDLVVKVVKSTTHIIGNLESALYKQADGTIHVDVGAGMTGKIFAIKDPI